MFALTCIAIGAALAAAVLLAVQIRVAARVADALNEMHERGFHLLPRSPKPPDPDATVVRDDAPHGPALPERQWTTEEIEAFVKDQHQPF